MTKKEKTRVNLIIGASLILQIAGRIINANVANEKLSLDSFLVTLAPFLIIGGWILIVWGAIEYAKAKGYKWYVGLLGILNIIGFIFLVLLPNKKKMEEKIKSNIKTEEESKK